MLTIAYATLAAYLAAFAATLILARFLTPAHWWRHANLRAGAVLLLGTWGIGALLLPLAASTQAAARPTAPPAPFVTFHDLNLRTHGGVHGQRIATVPAGTLVTPTGLRDGDWWQVTVRHEGALRTGWTNSLWLRAPAEVHPAPRS